jgi:hypothetical protein
MQSPVLAKPCDDPCDVIAVAPDAVRVAPSDEELSNLLHQAARHRSDTQTRAPSESPGGRTAPPVDTAFRAASVDDVLGSAGRSIARRAARGVIALLLAACIGLAAVAWKSYGDTAKKKMAKLAAQFILTSSLPSEEAAQTASAAVLDPASKEPASLVQTAPQLVGTAAEAPSRDSAQLLQSMARDLSALAREVEQLKAGMEQLKVSQQQTIQDVPKPSEQKLRTRTSGPALRSADARSRKPMSSFAGPQPATPAFRQAAEPYYVPWQAEPQPSSAEPSLVPRPPMPVR